MLIKKRKTVNSKVYKNSEGKIIYKQSTDKVGDTLINQAGVKYTIVGERFHPTTGYDDGRLKVRVLKVKTSEGIIFEISDSEMQHYRNKGILTRDSKKSKKAEQSKQKKTAAPSKKPKAKPAAKSKKRGKK